MRTKKIMLGLITGVMMAMQCAPAGANFVIPNPIEGVSLYETSMSDGLLINLKAMGFDSEVNGRAVTLRFKTVAEGFGGGIMFNSDINGWQQFSEYEWGMEGSEKPVEAVLDAEGIFEMSFAIPDNAYSPADFTDSGYAQIIIQSWWWASDINLISVEVGGEKAAPPFVIDDNMILQEYIGIGGKVNIPQDVVGIADHAFENAVLLTDIFIPSSVKTIGKDAFAGLPISNVFYGGNQEDWQKITIAEGNESLQKIMHYDCSSFHDYFIMTNKKEQPATYIEEGVLESHFCSVCKTRLAAKTTPRLDMPFTDVPMGGWEEEVARWMLNLGWMNGKTETKFDPNGLLNRGQVVTVLWNRAGKPKVSGASPFTDVVKGSTFYNPILWAYNTKIVSGKTETTFVPKDNVTRQQVAIMLMNLEKKTYVGVPNIIDNLANLSVYKDATAVSKSAETAVKWAVGNGILEPKDNGTKLDPKGMVTRIELAKIMQNYWQLHAPGSAGPEV